MLLGVIRQRCEEDLDLRYLLQQCGSRGVCVCVCVYVCVRVCACARVCVCERRIGGVCVWESLQSGDL